MLRFRWPVTAMATRSGTPARTMFRAAVRRKSWNGLPETPFGVLTPVAAAVVFSVMLVAGVSAQVRQGLFVTTGGYEYSLVLGVAGLTVAFTGPGALSLYPLLGYSVSGAFWGVAALLVGLVGWRAPTRSATTGRVAPNGNGEVGQAQLPATLRDGMQAIPHCYLNDSRRAFA